MTVRAFLCHSSSDKDFVGVVARRLGRARVAYDEFSFEPGQDFRDEIRRHLDRSSVFVFFVSRSSLDSIWCRFELENAEVKRMEGGIEAQLALLIEPEVAYGDLPPWMANARALRRQQPGQAARDVESTLTAAQTPEERRPFVGRQELSIAFGSQLFAQDYQPRLIVMTGLDGVGRRSYLKRVAQDALDLPVGPQILLAEESGLEDVYLRLLDETAPVDRRHEIVENLRAFQALDPDEQPMEVALQLGLLAQGRTIPVLVDRGALMESETGNYRRDWLKVFESFSTHYPDEYLALVQRRVPYVRDLPFRDRFVVQRVPPLTELDVKLLMVQLLNRASLAFTPGQVDELAEYLGGYPPAAYFAVAQANDYGLPALLADKSALVDFRAHRFVRFLDQISLEHHAWLALQYLAGESIVPLSAIALAVGVSEEEVAPVLRGLIDLSLVLVIDGEYSLSPPISDAVARARGLLAPEWYAQLLPRLKQRYWSQDDEVPTLSLIDLTLRAALRADGGATEYDDVMRVSAVHGIATESYHRRDYEAAAAYGRRAESIYRDRGDRRNLLEIQETMVKALTQLEDYAGALKILDQMQEASARRVWYLRSFLFRKQRRMQQAADALQSALDTGDRSNSVYRDYADILLRLGDPERARRMIAVVLERDPDNIWILDLVARIEIEGTDRERAKVALRDLERTDVDGRFIHHRRATYYLKAGNSHEALIAAEKAVDSENRGAAFETYAVLADALIEEREFDRFNELIVNLDNWYRNTRRDVRRGLRCKALLRQDRWREAATVWDALEEKNLPVHRALRASILESEAADDRVGLARRKEAAHEAEALRRDLVDTQPLFIDDDLEADPMPNGSDGAENP